MASSSIGSSSSRTELIKAPKNFDHIDRHYFATGFLLSSLYDGYSTDDIMRYCGMIDDVTSDRVRFIFYSDDIKDLKGVRRTALW